MKFVITGASGSVGQQLVPLLLERGHDVAVIGRNHTKIRQMFPQTVSGTYKDVVTKFEHYDVLLHLAVVNNDQIASITEVEHVNVDLALEMAHAAKVARIKKFVFVSSIQALDPSYKSDYAQSKRRAVEKLTEAKPTNLMILYLPLIYGTQYLGRLKWLNLLPKVLKSKIFQLFASLKPTLHVPKLADFLESMDFSKTTTTAILSDDIDKNVIYLVWRKFLDLTAGLVIVIGAGWLIAVLAILIRLESRGTGVFAQERIGLNGSPFVCYKLRTMATNTPQVGTHELSTSNVTNIGHILRRFKLDELPQAWNLLLGNMSLVGPRPCLPTQIALIKERKEKQVLDILPGITGLSQIRGIDMSDPQKLAQSDYEYRHTRSILLDIKILLATTKGNGGGDRVAQQNSI